MPVDFDFLIKALAGAATLIGGGVGLYSVGKRRISQDGVEVRSDKSRISAIQHLEDEREAAKAERDGLRLRLIAVEQERNAAVASAAKLGADVEHLSSKVGELETLVQTLRGELKTVTDSMNRYMMENAHMTSKLDYLVEFSELKCAMCNPKTSPELQILSPEATL
jgi:chromosome segregation ATPase